MLKSPIGRATPQSAEATKRLIDLEQRVKDPTLRESVQDLLRQLGVDVKSPN